MKKLQQVTTAEDYLTKVPEDVQKANTEKLAQSQGEIEIIEGALRILNSMIETS